jgi:hypothetical protein
MDTVLMLTEISVKKVLALNQRRYRREKPEKKKKKTNIS